MKEKGVQKWVHFGRVVRQVSVRPSISPVGLVSYVYNDRR